MTSQFCLVLCIFAGLYASAECCVGPWRRYPGTEGCYYFNPRPLPFIYAQSYCNRMGGNLVTVNDPEEDYRLGRYIEKTNVWIGLYSHAGSLFSWVNRERVSFLNWARGQPKENESDNVCGLWMVAVNKWVGAQCESLFPSVCEYGRPMPIPF